MKRCTAKKIIARVWRNGSLIRRAWFREPFYSSDGYTLSQVRRAIQVATDADLARIIEQPEEVRFWGEDYLVTRRYVPGKIGDGGGLLLFSPLNTRPNGYVLRVDSQRDIQDDIDEINGRELLDDVYEAVGDYFGRRDWECDDCEGKGCPCEGVAHDWPCLDNECGSTWGYWPYRYRRD